MSRRWEWPRNSGRIAEYDDYEVEMLQEFLNSGRRGVHLEIELLHTFKVEFPGARFIPSEPSRIMSAPFPADTAGTPTLEDT